MAVTETDRCLLGKVIAALRQARNGPLLVRFDVLADTLYVHIGHAPRPAIVDAINAGDRTVLLARLDPETDEVVGVQFEDVMARRLVEDRAMADLLAVAEILSPPPVVGPGEVVGHLANDLASLVAN